MYVEHQGICTFQEQFDERLQKKVDELMASYGNEDEGVEADG